MESLQTNVRTLILDAAEDVFCRSGFDGTSLKSIAASARVAQSLLSYHFKNKEGLYIAMFERHSSAMNRKREEALEEFLRLRQPTVERILEILLKPTMSLGRNSSTSFPRLLMKEVISDEPRSKKLIGESYDPLAKQFIEALQVALPTISRSDAVWGYTFSIGVAMAMMAPTGRPSRLSDGECNDSDIDAVLNKVVIFAAAGLRKFAEN